LLVPQLGDERLVGPIEERHLAQPRSRFRAHSPWLLAASERSQLTMDVDDPVNEIDIRPAE
jgi:hypothetical protein